MLSISQTFNPSTPKNSLSLSFNLLCTGMWAVFRSFCLNCFSGLWILETKIVLDHDFLVSPSKTFHNWSEKREEPLPFDAYWLYVTVIGFYIQALVCCILIGNEINFINQALINFIE